MKLKNQILICLIALTFSNCDQSNEKSTSTSTADAIYFGGDIITMEGDSANYAEAIAIRDGKIIYVGSKTDAEKYHGDSTKMIDLVGKTLLPGFIDAHGHIWNAGFQSLASNLLPPPDGEGRDIASIIKLLGEWKTKNEHAIGKYGWIIGFGYDDGQLKEKSHPTADDLDKVSKDIPVLIIHQSGHLAVMNHKALEFAGFNSKSKDPAGGVIRRKAGSLEPNGVLEEMAFFIPVMKIMTVLDSTANETIAKAGIANYVRFGFTTAQEGRASEANAETWKKIGKEGNLTIDVAAYMDLQSQMTYMRSVGTQRNYTNHFRIAGVKLSLDGSPQGKTAWLTRPYVVPPAGQKADYKGYPAMPNKADVFALVDTAFKYNWQVLAHCSGDAAGDEFISAIRNAADLFGNNDRRSVMIHAHTARMDQLDSMKVLGIIPSFFSMHTYYWGDWHVSQTMGKERAYQMEATNSARKRGMIFTEHHDAPVALPNSIMILYTTVNRISRSGVVIGPDERVRAYDALRSITCWAAFQYFEENSKGTLQEGKLADFVILDKNPIKVDPKSIDNIQVIETIKEGKSVYLKQ